MCGYNHFYVDSAYEHGYSGLANLNPCEYCSAIELTASPFLCERRVYKKLPGYDSMVF